MTQKLDQLVAEAEVARREAAEAKARLHEVEEAVLMERFKDIERFKEGDIVLVPRKLFGEHKMWPAKIREVQLNYNSGTHRTGDPWESMSVSYLVFLKQKDGTFSGSSKGFFHQDVAPAV